MTTRDHVRALVDATDGPVVTVPKVWALELLGEHPNTAEVQVDKTASEVATMFGRKAATVRGWATAGLFPGAYRLHGTKEWRFTPASIRAFQDQQRQGGTVELGSWRKVGVA